MIKAAIATYGGGKGREVSGGCWGRVHQDVRKFKKDGRRGRKMKDGHVKVWLVQTS